ncbi:MAG: hypothetical protein EXS19_06825 [Pedosphaera sp.]|nr:hypothetical protein [Pedosphaera sp.]
MNHIQVIDSHTGGESTCGVISGGPDLGSASGGGQAAGLPRAARRLPPRATVATRRSSASAAFGRSGFSTSPTSTRSVRTSNRTLTRTANPLCKRSAACTSRGNSTRLRRSCSSAPRVALAAKATLESLRARLDQWMRETNDHGPESESRYDSDIAAYLGKGNPEVEKNIILMKQWAKEGK